MWTFAQKRDNKQWLWLALCRRTKQIVGYYIGDRGIKACKQFSANIAPGYQNLITKSDMWKAYNKTFDPSLHECSEYRGETSHIERCNATVRARMGRLVRKSLSFSKQQAMHISAIHVFINKYNVQKANEYRKLTI